MSKNVLSSKYLDWRSDEEESKESDVEGKKMKTYAPETSSMLFVYGSCMTGYSLNVALLRDRLVGKDMTLPTYRMINVMDKYPTIVTGGNTAVVGELYELALPTATLDFLDSIMSCPETHNRDIVSLESGVRAHIYILNSYKLYGVSNVESILSGNWAEWKKGERERVKKKKNDFLARMMKGKMDKEARLRGLSAIINAPSAASGSKSNASAIAKNATANGWSTVNTFIDAEGRRIYVADDGKKAIHISDMDPVDLRIILSNEPNLQDVDVMTDGMVRVNCMARYGLFYPLPVSI